MTTRSGRDVRLGRVVLGVVAFVVLLNLVILLVREIGKTDVVPGPPGSTYVTTAGGSAALFELLDQQGLNPIRQRQSVVREAMSPDEVLIQMGGRTIAPTGDEAEVIANFVSEGGRLILAGPVEDHFLTLLGGDSTWHRIRSSDNPAFQVFEDLPAVGAQVIQAPAFGYFQTPGTWAPLYIDEAGDPMVLVHHLDEGDVFWLADSAFFSNGHIDEADNAELAIALIAGLSPVFDETIHGFVESGGLLPDKWAVAFWLAIGAAIVGLVSYGTRRGPPEEVARDLGPARAEYVESMGSLLARTAPRSEALAPIRAEAARAIVGADGNVRAAVDDAVRAGLTRAEAMALLADEDPEPADMASAFAKLMESMRLKV